MKWMVIICLVCLVHLLGNSATYYVATNGNNAADGSAETPWLNVWKAASTATAGDTVIVGAGEFNEFVTNTVSGDAGNPITFMGTRGVSGEWLTIIDPSTLMTNGWVEAAEIGAGVWKQTNMPFATRELTIDHKRVAFVYTNGNMKTAIDNAYQSSGLSNGCQFLTLATDAELAIATFNDEIVDWWDAVGAIYGTTNSPDYITYLRLRDGSDPNGLNIRAAPNDNAFAYDDDAHFPVINIANQSNIIWQNFLLRGAICGVMINQSHDITIKSNYIANGHYRLTLYGASAYGNLICSNQMTTAYYGYDDPGAWGGGGISTVNRANLYVVSKFLMGVSESFDDAVYLTRCGNSNVISGNHIYDSLGSGVTITMLTWSSPPAVTNTVVCDNVIEGHPSCGVTISPGNYGTRVYGNLIADCNSNFRFHNLNDGSDSNRLAYIYRNRVWLPDDIGNNIFTHFLDDGEVYHATFWIYNNSFSGGTSAITDNGFAYLSGGFPNFHYLNNVMNVSPYVSSIFYTAIWTNSSMMGSFNYNLVIPPMPPGSPPGDPAWFGANNVKSTTAQWFNAEGMSFALTNGSPAINAGMDIPTTYPDLPQDGTVKVGTAWDMGALEYGAGPILRVGNLFSAPK